LRAYRAFPKNKPLIKFLSEAGIDKFFKRLKTSTYKISEEMPTVDEALYLYRRETKLD